MKRVVWPLTALSVVAAGVYVAFAHDVAGARARLAGHSDTIETSFGRLEYAVAGEGEPMLIVHGAGGGFDQGLDMTGEMAKRGYRLIAPSRFGYLRSALPDKLTTAMQADAYVQLLDHLGVNKAVIVGISAGAWSSIQFAIRHPERCRALVLLVPANYLPPGTANHGGAVARAIFESDFVAWAALKLMPVMPGGMTKMMLGTDAAVIHAAGSDEQARVQQILDHLLPVSSRLRGMQFDIDTAATRESYPLERIVCPVIAISAEDDSFHTAERAKLIVSAVHDGRIIIFPAGGHALVGHYADALREIGAFLQAVDAGRAPA
jgi:2-hydroxy-6-oxonona-2,4-dienedioate hydrolase